MTNPIPKTRSSLTVSTAIKNEEIIKAASVLSNIHEAMMVLPSLEPETIDALIDEFKEMAKTRTGPRGELKRAWWEFAKSMRDDAKVRERIGIHGLYETVDKGLPGGHRG